MSRSEKRLIQVVQGCVEKRLIGLFSSRGTRGSVEELSLRVSLQRTDADLTGGKLEIEVHLVESAGQGGLVGGVAGRRRVMMFAGTLGDESGQADRGSESG